MSISKPLIAAAMLAFVTVGCGNVGQKSILRTLLSDFDPDLYVAILSVSIILGLVLRYMIRMPSKQPQKPKLDRYETAYLAGGSSRAVELAITQLVHQGYLRPNVRNRTLATEKTLPPEATHLEQQVMRQVHHTPDLKSLQQTSKYRTHFLQERLKQEKLLMAGWADLIGSSFAIFLLTTIFGGMLVVPVLLNILNIKVAADPNTITALWQAIGIITLCCLVPSGRTRWGSRILADIQKNHDVYDVTQRFALYGYQMLSGGTLDDLKQIFKAEEEAAAGGCGCGC